MNSEIFEIYPEDPIGPDEPYHPVDPGDYPPGTHGNEKPEPVIPPVDPEPEPFEPGIDPDDLIPEDPEDDGEMKGCLNGF